MMLQSLSKMKTGETKSFSGYLLTVSTHTAMNSFVSDSVPTAHTSNHNDTSLVQTQRLQPAIQYFTLFWILYSHNPHVLYTLQTLTCRPFLVFAVHLPPMVLVLQPPLCGTHSHLTFATLPLPIPSVAFLKLTASSRLSAPPSGSPKCLRFGLWLTLAL